jgi:hypothetical protein
VAQRGVEIVDLVRGQPVLAPLRGGVNLAERQARLIGEIALEQPMGPDDLQRHALAVGRELELLSIRRDEPLVLHPNEQVHQPAVAQSERPAERSERAPPSAVLLLEQVLERILDARPVACRVPAPQVAVGSSCKHGDERQRDEQRRHTAHRHPIRSVFGSPTGPSITGQTAIFE